MRSRGRTLAACLAATIGMLGLLGSPAGAYTRPVRTVQVNLSSSGNLVNSVLQENSVGSASISDDGRWVAFHTDAALVPQDLNQMTDIYLRDMTSGKLSLVTRGPAGTAATGLPLSSPGGSLDGRYLSMDPQISGNGRFIAFTSSAGNLVAGDQNQTSAGDVFIFDRLRDSFVLASVDSREGQSLEAERSLTPDSVFPSISDDGRFVSFSSRANGLVEGDTNEVADIFVRDRIKGETTRVSISSSGQESDGCAPTEGGGASLDCTGKGIYFSSISGNGRYVVFDGWASDLVEGDTNRMPDVFISDLKTGKVKRVSVTSDGSQTQETGSTPGTDQQFGSRLTCCGSSPSVGRPPGRVVSDDGRFIAFLSAAENLVPNDAAGREPLAYRDLLYNKGFDVFVHDMKTGATERVSTDSYGSMWRSGSGEDPPSLSGDGRFVLYRDFVANHPDQVQEERGGTEVYVHDRATGATEIVSTTPEGNAGECCSYWASDISRDGRYVAYWSNASNLTRQEDKNDAFDLFFADRGRVLGASLSKTHDVAPGNGAGSAAASDARSAAVPAWSGQHLPEVRVVSRPGFDDLFVFVEVPGMGGEFGNLGPQTFSFGLSFEVRSKTYEVRVGSLPKPSLELFDCTGPAGSCLKVADLRGGVGTTGERIVFSVPMSAIGLESAEPSALEAFHTVGDPGLFRAPAQ